MLDDQGFEIFEQNEFPLAYLITFRTYGTWLHGDERTSFQRTRKTATETKRISSNIPLQERMADEMKQSAIVLSLEQRKAVEYAIRDLCPS